VIEQVATKLQSAELHYPFLFVLSAVSHRFSLLDTTEQDDAISFQ